MNVRRKPTCLSCGERQGTDDRFCGQCGSPAVTGPAVGRWSERAPEPELLLVAPDDEPQTRLLDPVAIVLGFAAVTLLGLSAWGLLRSSTVRLSGIGDGIIGVLAVDPVEPEPTGTGTEEAVNVFETFDIRAVGPEDQLIVERETDTSLLAASDIAWTLIDLDTGDRQRLESQGSPVLISNNFLVVERDQSLWSIPLAELGHDSTGVQLFSPGIDDGEEEPGLLAASLSGDDEMLVVNYGFERPGQVARLDLATGDRSGAEETPSYPFALHYAGLYEATGGGTFDVIDGSWSKISNGAPVIAGPRRALFRICTEPLECRYEWLDRQSGRRLDRPVPEILIDADRRQRSLFPVDLDGQVIATFGPDGFTVADVAKDRVLALDARLPEGLELGETRIEPLLPFTARLGLVAVATGSGLELMDLEDDVLYRLEPDFFGPRPRRYLLVPS